jgi:hypothetical protein|tara:strand:- start:439 stop:810 length:372 start_codon:yes stop_codon:yes gene_type:complete
MRFDELNEDNYVMFAIKHYENPHAVTQDDFYEDLKRFKWIKRLLKRYQTTGILKSHLLINHFIILYNVFGEAATPLLFFKIDRELWPVVKTFVVYLGRLPEYPRSTLHDIPIDTNCLQDLDQI